VSLTELALFAMFVGIAALAAVGVSLAIAGQGPLARGVSGLSLAAAAAAALLLAGQPDAALAAVLIGICALMVSAALAVAAAQAGSQD
jgi:hypothetical protein